MLWLAGDRGACFLPTSDTKLANPIKITHFGLTTVTDADASLPGNDFVHLPDKEHACYRPQRDIVAAPYFARQEDLAAAAYASAALDGAAAASAPGQRPTLLFFAGNVGADDPAYSGGVRQVGGVECVSSNPRADMRLPPMILVYLFQRCIHSTL